MSSICAISECNSYSVLQEIKTINSNASTYKIRGNSLLQTLDEINGNRRVYTRAIGEIYVDTANKKIAGGRLLGEMDHPFIRNPKDPMEVKRQLIVLWEKVSHKFTKMWIEGNNICAIVETLSNRNGVDLAKMANIDEIPIGFSCRAVGKVKPANFQGQSIMEVTEPTIFVTYDSVTDPSHKSAELKDITSVITSTGELEKMRQMSENNEGICIDESNELYELAKIFKNNHSTEPMVNLIEGFMNNYDYNIHNMCQEKQKKYVQKRMTGILSEYLNSSDKITGISEYSTFNESNVRDFMDDYAYTHSYDYNDLKSIRNKINQYLM